jgi:hypothetical protein
VGSNPTPSAIPCLTASITLNSFRLTPYSKVVILHAILDASAHA